MRRIIIACTVITTLLSISCKEGAKKDDNTINTDVINNPASANGETNTEYLPKFSFEKDTHDFGSIVQGEKVSYSFKFKNTGKSDLVITTASGSCGCTVPNYPKEPIVAGGEGKIDVTFDSNGKQGKQTKTVSLIANTMPNTTVLTITGEVTVPENKQ